MVDHELPCQPLIQLSDASERCSVHTRQKNSLDRWPGFEKQQKSKYTKGMN